MKIRAPLTLAFVAFAFFSTAAMANDGSCMQDAFSICGQFIPNRDRVAACLMSNRDRVSVACRAALTHFRPQAEPVSY